MIERRTPLTDAFATADDVLRQAIQGISDLILVPGLINLDFADVKTIMNGRGVAVMGTGIGEGETRALDAARLAVSSPLLEDASIEGAHRVIINVTGGPDLSLVEVHEASSFIQEAAHEDANIIFGAVVDPSLENRVKITVIATGFERDGSQASVPACSSQTPVDLQHYSTWSRAHGDGVDQGVPAPITLARRPVLDLPARRVANGGLELSPDGMSAADAGDSPLDVPAFLRRQHEG
jgi:cell division protein FtsZ